MSEKGKLPYVKPETQKHKPVDIVKGSGDGYYYYYSLYGYLYYYYYYYYYSLYYSG
jgi:hypothetical protein